MTEDPRISEIRAVLAEVDAIHPLDFRSIPSVGSVVDRIRAILDRPAPAPRVFLPGDPIPPGTRATTVGALVYDTLTAHEETTCAFPLVEVVLPSRQYLEGLVRDEQRRRAERGEA